MKRSRGQPARTRSGGMTRALDRDGNVVRARDPEQFERWHRKAGLRCLTCKGDVHLQERSNGNVWVRHSPAGERACAAAAAGGSESYEHEVLKYEIRKILNSLGFQAECEKRVGFRTPDVWAVAPDGRRLAVEVQLAYLSEDEARKRTEDLRAEDCEVLWVTRHCNWVERLPAVGLAKQETRRSRATLIDGAYYWLHQGVLTCQPDKELHRSAAPSLEQFFEFYGQHRVSWALVHLEHYGWAVDSDWKKHLEWQAHQITDLKGKAAAMHDEIEKLRAEALAKQAEYQTELAKMHQEAVEAQRRIDEMAKHLADRTERVRVLNTGLSSAQATMNEERCRSAKIRGELDRARRRTTAVRGFGLAILAAGAAAIVVWIFTSAVVAIVLGGMLVAVAALLLLVLIAKR